MGAASPAAATAACRRLRDTGFRSPILDPSNAIASVGPRRRQAAVAVPCHRADVEICVDNARDYIDSVRWQFARTMPQWPHEYTVREWCPDLETAIRGFVVLIRRQGVIKPWPLAAATPRYRHTYLEVDGWEYWTMGFPVAETTVINRARGG